jgi:hypothetical protein
MDSELDARWPLRNHRGPPNRLQSWQRRERWRFLVVLLAILPLAACGSGSDEKASGPRQSLSYELLETTKLLDAGTLAALTSISDDRTLVTFSATTPLLDALAPSDVLLSGKTDTTPQGLLVQVDSLESSSAGVVVHAHPATVFHAFRRLDLEVAELRPTGDRTDLPQPAPTPPLGATRQALVIPVPLGNPDFDEPLFEGDNQTSDEDRVSAKGHLVENVMIKFWLHFDWQDLTPDQAFSALDNLLDSLTSLFEGKPPDLGDLLHLKMGFRVDGDADVSLDVKGSSALSFERDFPFGTPYVIAPIVIGPLYLQPTLTMTAHFTGGVAGSLDMNYGFGTNFGLGFDYDGNLTPIVSGPDFSTITPTTTVSAAASLRTELELRLSLLMYGFLGPYASIVPYGDVEADRTATPCFRFTAGIEGEVGAEIGLLGKTLKSIQGPRFPIGDPQELASGDCKPLPNPAPTDNLITPWSKSYGGDNLVSLGTDEGFTNLELSNDGRLLLTSVASNAVFKVTESGDLAWARTFRQPDRADFPELNPTHAVPMIDTGILVSTQQYVLVKTEQNASYDWAAQLETDSDADGFWAAKRVGDSIWLGGPYSQLASTERQAWLVGLAPDGSVEFSWLWGTPTKRESIRHILPLDDGAIVVGEGDGRGFLLYVNLDGTIRWAKTVDDCATEDLVLSTAILTRDDNILVGGWFYATETEGLLFRVSRDGTESAPAWATRTGVRGEILGPEVRSIHQLDTGELRVVGRYAEATGDRVFAAMTDSIGRFGWLQRYGGTDGTAPPTSTITTRGGLLIGSGSATLEPLTGGYWLFEVPTPNGRINFDPASGIAMDSLTPTSQTACLTIADAPTTTMDYALPMTLVDVEVNPAKYPVHLQ